MRRIIRLTTVILISGLSLYLSFSILRWQTGSDHPTNVSSNALWLGGTLSVLSFLLSSAVRSLLRGFMDSTRIEDLIAIYPQSMEGADDALLERLSALNIHQNLAPLGVPPIEITGSTERAFLWADSTTQVDTFEEAET